VIDPPPPPPPPPDDGLRAARQAAYIGGPITIFVPDDATPEEEGHAVTKALKMIQRFNGGGD
jgi:hypothetical protein